MSAFDFVKDTMPEDVRKYFEKEIEAFRNVVKEKYNNPSDNSSFITVEEMIKDK